MALAAHRCTSQQLITLALQLAVITALFADLANAAANKETVKYTLNNFTYDVHYGIRFHIPSSKPKEGGFRSDSNGDIHLAGENDLGAIVQLVPVSGSLGLNAPVYVNDTVYITSVDQPPPAINPGWGWRKQGKSKWVLTWKLSPKDRAKFKIIPTPGNSEQIIPPVLFYYLQSCPGNYCSGLTRFIKGGVTYVKLGNERSEYGDLTIGFFPNLRLAMSTDK